MNLSVVGYGGYVSAGEKNILDASVEDYFTILDQNCDKLECYIPINKGEQVTSTKYVFEVHSFEKTRGGYLKLLFQLIRTDNKDVLFLFMPTCSRLAPFLPVLRRLYKKIVIYLADDPFAFTNTIQLSSIPLLSMYYRMVCESYLRRADGILVRGKYLEALGVRYNSRVEITSPQYTLLEKRRSVREKGDNDYTILTFSRLVMAKGYGVLFRALRNILDRESIEIRLLLAGDGLGRQEIELMAREIIPDVDYSFLGWVSSTKEKQVLWEQADLHVLATTTTEGVPRCIDEACLVSVPTIATKVGGVPYEYTNGEVCLIEPGSVQALTDALEGFLFRNYAMDFSDGIAFRERYLRAMKLAGQQHYDFISSLQ